MLNTDKFLHVGNPGTATNLSAPGYTVGNTTINVASTADFPTDTAVIFGIDTATTSSGVQVRTPGSYCVFVGIVTSSTSIGSVVLLIGTPQNYAASALTRVYITVSSQHTNRLIDGILAFANQDGTLKPTAVQTAIGTGGITNTNLATGIQSSKLTNPYKFSAYRNAALNSVSSVPTKLALDTKEFDTSSNFDSTTNYRFTAPIAGFYQFNARFSVAASSAVSYIALYKNGVESRRGSLGKANAEYQGVTISTMLSLAATDYIEVYYLVNAVLAFEVGASQTYLQGFLVSTT